MANWLNKAVGTLQRYDPTRDRWCVAVGALQLFGDDTHEHELVRALPHNMIAAPPPKGTSEPEAQVDVLDIV